MAKQIKNAPGWLGLTDDKTAFVYLPDRAEVVRHIFELSIGGLGGYTIAKLLTSKNVPAFGRSKTWDQSTIHNMLSNRATIGEYQAKQKKDGRRHPIGDPIPGYYPAVIDEETFQAAQRARRKNLVSGRGRKGLLISNLFAGLATCHYCGKPIKFRSQTSSKSLVCHAALKDGSCYRFAWSYNDFENSFFELLNKTSGHAEIRSQLSQLRATMAEHEQAEVYATRVAIAQLVKASVSKLQIASAGIDPPSTDADGPIRSNYAKRFFVASFSDGSVLSGFPAAPKATAPRQKFDPESLSKLLGLSPRQGALTALLAEGVSLTEGAAQLGMTLSTARWHLREIFKRTNSHSQSDLGNIVQEVSSMRTVDPEKEG
jgi:DNA-binding CsgD family transcriptional regulator